MSVADIIVVDGPHLMHRMARSHASDVAEVDDEVVPIGGVKGFLLKLVDLQLQYCCRCVVTWEDRTGMNFRMRLFPAYKQRRMSPARKLMKAEVVQQIEILKRILTACGIRQYEAIDSEADDAITRIALKMYARRKSVCIYSGDSDMRQLVRENGSASIFVHSEMGRVNDVFDTKEVVKRYGIQPPRIVDLKCLEGDKSDKIPGVPGIGKTMARALLCKFDGLKEVFRATRDENSDWPVHDRFKEIIWDARHEVVLYRALINLEGHRGARALKRERSVPELKMLLKRYNLRAMLGDMSQLFSLGG